MPTTLTHLLLPLEEEGRLHDMHLRENLIDRVFAHYRWANLLRENPTLGGLVKFHTAHKLTLMAHNPSHYQEIGRLVAHPRPAVGHGIRRVSVGLTSSSAGQDVVS